VATLTPTLAPGLGRFRLDGRNVLITGGGRGIGRSLATGLAGVGADVCVASRTREELETVCEEIRGLGQRAAMVTADLLDPASPERLVDETIEALGSVDVLVNNAGESIEKRAFTDVPMSDWRRYLDLLLTSQVAVTQAVVRSMIAAGRGGSIVNVASIYGLRGAPGGEKELGSVTYYSAAKHALVGLTRTLGIELAPFNIRVNALCPGWVDTSMNALADMGSAFLQRNLDQIPMGRWAIPEEMVGPTVFLSSDASSFMTGQTLVVDGGHLA
jgi:NAD(P)-dependent dehydrogenase (short-subunit alcohol dehydrogenase family)